MENIRAVTTLFRRHFAHEIYADVLKPRTGKHTASGMAQFPSTPSPHNLSFRVTNRAVELKAAIDEERGAEVLAELRKRGIGTIEGGGGLAKFRYSIPVRKAVAQLGMGAPKRINADVKFEVMKRIMAELRIRHKIAGEQ